MDNALQKCATCDGMGVVQVASPTDQDDGTALCPMCDGSGEEDEIMDDATRYALGAM